MAASGWWGKKLLVGMVIVLGLVGAAAWVERGPLLAWFSLRQLASANDSNRETWVTRVVALGDDAVPGLLDSLARPGPAACGNVRVALDRLAATWGADDPRTIDLSEALAREYSHMSAAGQRETLLLVASWCAPPQGRAVLRAASRLLGESTTTEPEVFAAALELCAAVLNLPDNTEAIAPAQDLVRSGLHSPVTATRIHAVQLVLKPGMDLLEQVVPLLSDSEAEVRRAAMLAVGPAREAREAVPDECLLPSLHDTDPEVRRLCEEALASRGLKAEYLQLGRLLTHPAPAQRLQVLDQLQNSTDLDTGLWLRRLSHDPSPAVRVAAMRAMVQQPFLDLTDRIDQMARSDPSPTVSQLARYYLNAPKPGRPGTTGQQR
jgi:hypothetical protein